MKLAFNIFDTLMDGVAVIERDMNLVYANEATANLCGVSLKRLKAGVNLLDFFRPEDETFFEKVDEIRSPTSYREMSFQTKNNGTVYLRISIQPAEETASNHQWVLFIKDVTLERQLQTKFTSERLEREEAVKRSLLDPLTQIPNKGSFLERFDLVFRKAKQERFVFSVIVFDIDDFKKINDLHGHRAGDLVLFELARLVHKTILRTGDFFARFGGEEFVVLLDRQRADTAVIVAERIRSGIETHSFDFQGIKISVTVSLGVAEMSPETQTPEELFELADRACYRAKKLGKNGVNCI